MHRLNQNVNGEQLDKRKDEADLSFATLKVPKCDINGDSKWFLKRRAVLN
jgi:hypothetical protein